MRLIMSLIRRTVGRVSAGRRSRFAAPLVLLLGLLVTGGMYADLSPASAQTQSRRRGPGRQGPRALPGRLRLLPRQERRGHQHRSRAASTAPRWSASAPPPWTSRSAPAGCRWPSPVTRRCASPRSTTRTRSRRSRRSSPRSAPVPRSRPRTSTTSPASPPRTWSAAASSSAPTARRATTSPAPAAPCPRGRFAPTLTGVSAKHIYEAMLTGPQQMPVFSDEVLTPEDKRQIISYLKKNEDHPGVRRVHAGLAGPRVRGPVRLAGRHRRARGLRGVDRGQPRPFDEEEEPTA